MFVQRPHLLQQLLVRSLQCLKLGTQCFKLGTSQTNQSQTARTESSSRESHVNTEPTSCLSCISGAATGAGKDLMVLILSHMSSYNIASREPFFLHEHSLFCCGSDDCQSLKL